MSERVRIVVCSDAHLDWVTMGVPRFDEIAEALGSTVDEARGGLTADGEAVPKADLWLFLGDAGDPDGDSWYRWVEYLIRTAALLSSEGVESHFIAGNHDVWEDGSGHTTLWPVAAIGENSGLCRNVFVHERPWKMLVPARRPLVNLIALPFSSISHPYDPADFLERSLDRNRINLVAAHATIIPGVTPGSEDEMPRGKAMEFPVAAVEAAIREGYKVVCLNGHFHRRQSIMPQDGGPQLELHIPGSLARLTVGEDEHEPAWLVLDLEV